MGIPNGFWGDRIQEQGEGEPTTWLECDKLTLPESVSDNWIGLDTCSAGKKTFSKYSKQ